MRRILLVIFYRTKFCCASAKHKRILHKNALFKAHLCMHTCFVYMQAVLSERQDYDNISNSPVTKVLF